MPSVHHLCVLLSKMNYNSHQDIICSILFMRLEYFYLIIGLFVGFVLGYSAFALMLFIVCIIAFFCLKHFAVIDSKFKHVLKKISSNKKEIYIEKEALQNMDAYCQWAQIKSMDDFIEHAALTVFAKDKEWRAYQKRNL